MSAGEKVVVGCKLPHGLILELGTPPKIRRVTLKGSNSTQIVGVNPLVGQFGLTPDVDKDFIDEWLTKNADLVFVKTKMIFVQKDQRSAEAEAREKFKLKSGLEPLNPQNAPKGVEALPTGATNL